MGFGKPYHKKTEGDKQQVMFLSEAEISPRNLGWIVEMSINGVKLFEAIVRKQDTLDNLLDHTIMSTESPRLDMVVVREVCGDKDGGLSTIVTALVRRGDLWERVTSDNFIPENLRSDIKVIR